jgi:hypothetical protein
MTGHKIGGGAFADANPYIIHHMAQELVVLGFVTDRCIIH